MLTGNFSVLNLCCSIHLVGKNIRFCNRRFISKPPNIEMLAQEAGFEPEVLELLKKRGLTNMSNLLDILGSEDDSTESKSSDGEETGESTDHDRRTDGSGRIRLGGRRESSGHCRRTRSWRGRGQKAGSQRRKSAS